MKKNIRKVKTLQKTLMFLLIILIFVLGMTVDKIMKTNADEINYEYQSNNIDYDNSTSNLSATNVKDAIDELYSKVGQCPSGQFCYNKNMAFVKAYTYDESVCITGDETECVETTCYKNGTCPVGTIIDYRVDNLDNEKSVVRFHVLHDNGTSLTMQTQRNTIYNVAWHAGEYDSSKGPDTIMSALKTATDGWVNIKPITITSGTTSFTGVDLIDNLCTHDSEGNVTCSGNQYGIGLISGTYRVRMITMQEAIDPNIGQCLSWVSESVQNNKSCRMFINNYLYESTYSDYCKNPTLCVEDDHTENGGDHNWGYWTMGTYSFGIARSVDRRGHVGTTYTSKNHYGARAVVVVNK